jgi:hypothetical protein
MERFQTCLHLPLMVGGPEGSSDDEPIERLLEAFHRLPDSDKRELLERLEEEDTWEGTARRKPKSSPHFGVVSSNQNDSGGVTP